MGHQPQIAVPPMGFLTRKDLAALLRISERTTYNWERDRLLPEPHMFNDSPRWSLPEFNAWRDAGSPKLDDWKIMKKSTAGQRA